MLVKTNYSTSLLVTVIFKCNANVFSIHALHVRKTLVLCSNKKNWKHSIDGIVLIINVPESNITAPKGQ